MRSLSPSGFLVGAVLAAVASAGAVRTSTEADEPPCGPTLALESLDALHAEPRAHLGRIARVHLQLKGERASWEPYLTRFGPGDYRAFDAWSDEQLLWDEADFVAPRAVLFARVDGEAARTLRGAPAYARFEALVRVEQLLLGRPWIEVYEVTRLPESVNEGALVHASRGTRFLLERRWDRAAEDLRRALASNLPAAARRDLEWRLALAESGGAPPAPPGAGERAGGSGGDARTGGPGGSRGEAGNADGGGAGRKGAGR